MNMGYMQEPVRLVGLASGFALGFLGNSHYGIEDVAVLRSIPGITIVSPADCFELYKCIVASLDFPGPIYIRLTGGVNMPVVYDADYEFDISKADVLSDISDITVVSAGATLGFAKVAVEELKDEGTQVGLVNVHTIKPIDKEFIAKLKGKCTKLVVFEEHTVIGGLGSAIIDALDEAKIRSVEVIRCGVNDEYPKAGDYNYVLSSLGLDSAGIKTKLCELLQKMIKSKPIWYIYGEQALRQELDKLTSDKTVNNSRINMLESQESVLSSVDIYDNDDIG